MCRRVFQRWLMQELSAGCSSGASRWFAEEDGGSSSSSMKRFRLRADVRLAMYLSHTPCGDASIFETGEELPMQLRLKRAREVGDGEEEEEVLGEPSRKRQCNRHRTGAKPTMLADMVWDIGDTPVLRRLGY